MSSISAVVLSLTLVLLSYLAGSVSFAVVVSRLMGLQDPRTFGSKNPGATNVLRTGNKKAAVLTLLGDAAKGWLAVWFTGMLAAHFHLPSLVVGASAIAVFLGHIYPIFLNFKGGKGVATALGVLLALQPWLAAATACTWLIVAYATRYSSLAAIMAAIFAPLYYLFGGDVAWDFDAVICLAIALISAGLIARHRANIARLMTGKEGRIGGKPGAH
ncbi:glycerol-3-phosphate 1-O-acyltransferase PlsY [Paralcaligenes ureilyticus]|uniref:Glycerol-3-phosphate acyltransferase n=1 Tax=Paralcaligenes ureilyticus TaxID=627131 RepID=A0A4R3LTF7_9BURK|nr:glycerol-3-phosphate 1-O-acyltransferase PlsY [Paralcaligenes ureilyticus]TCT01607.1 acyl-phosphate glycerol-3-phosphate acyltransferase [Paralcaligenes ureilyticus]